jgi:CRISPR/Cas system-associated endoribonuclease Cas2
MSVLLVTYDLNKETKRPNIVAEVKKTDWARLSESSYAIDTTESPQQVVARFGYLIDGNDDFLVITLKRPHHGQASKEVIDWLERRLTH